MKTKTTSALLALFAFLVLSACAGTPFKWGDARRIEAGMTTAQVTQLIGPPNNVSARGDTVRYVWVWVNTLAGTTKTLTVDFSGGRAIKAPPIPPEFTD